MLGGTVSFCEGADGYVINSFVAQAALVPRKAQYRGPYC